jgi:hypothetical protein
MRRLANTARGPPSVANSSGEVAGTRLTDQLDQKETGAMPNTNGAIIARVKVTATGGTIEEETIPSNAAFDVVVEAEAGTNVFNSNQSYKLQMVLTDYTANFTTTNTQTLSGSFGDANWSNQEQLHRFPVPALGAGRDDHALRAFAVLQVGKKDPIVDYEEGEVFVITPA